MTMYLDDTLTEQELADASAWQRCRAFESRHATHNPAANPHGIPFKGTADPRLIVAGDVIAVYAGNEHPSHVVTVESAEHDDVQRVVNFATTDGEYTVAYGMTVWVAAYAPLLGD